MTIRSVVVVGILVAGCGEPIPENGGEIVGETEAVSGTGTDDGPTDDRGEGSRGEDPTGEGPDEGESGETGPGETGVVEECPPASEFGPWCDGCSNTLAVNQLNDCDILDCGVSEQGSGFDETGGEDEAVEYDDAQICFFEAMRDRTPAKLRIRVSEIIFGGTVMRYVDGDGTILETDYTLSDDADCTPDWDPIERCTLAEAAYFAECLTTTDETTMQACKGWHTWSTGCSVVSVDACPG